MATVAVGTVDEPVLQLPETSVADVLRSRLGIETNDTPAAGLAGSVFDLVDGLMNENEDPDDSSSLSRDLLG